MLKIVVLVSGGGTNLQAIQDGIADGSAGNIKIEAVISNNQKAYALERAKKAGIPAICISPKEFESRQHFDEALKKGIMEFNPDFIVLAGFLVTIPKQVIEQFPERIINIHPSLIPSFCGKGFYGIKVHEAALERGVKVTGATVHFVDGGMDSGPIILQKTVEVKEGDTPEKLQLRVMKKAEWIILPQAVKMLAEGKISIQNGKAVIKE